MKPFYFWHDATLPGHAVLCAMGLLRLRYLRWELRARELSMKDLVQALALIRVAVVRTPEGKVKPVRAQLGSPEAHVYNALNLPRFVPE
ncbi:MAG: hypothetical protein ACREDK_02270 [Thermoplasmata archaeon]